MASDLSTTPPRRPAPTALLPGHGAAGSLGRRPRSAGLVMRRPIPPEHAGRAEAPTGWGTVYTDTHCHLELLFEEQDQDNTIERARHAGVTTLITVGVDLA